MDEAGAEVKLEQTFAAVEGIGRDLNAVTSATVDRARTLARKSADRGTAGESPRSLEGIPFAIKDVIDIAGFPTTMGSKVSSGPDPSTTAPVVQLLERAGALPVAKTNCQEYSYGILGDESAFGRVINPIDPALCTAGSSSGSAALVAADVVPLALGTDTAGSVRVPAACQGVIGFKPTFGAVVTEGVFPLSPSFDTVGLFARDFGLLTAAFHVISESDPSAADAQQVSSDVVVDLSLLNSAGDSSADDSTADSFDAGVRAWVESHVAEVRVASANFGSLASVIDRCTVIYDIVRSYEAHVLHKAFLTAQGELYQPGVWAKIMAGQNITEDQYHAQITALEELRAFAEAIFDDVDFIITPAIEGEVIRWDQVGSESAAKFMRYSMPFNVLGWPAVTVPIGATTGRSGAEALPGQPESIQIVGAPHSDAKLLRFAAGL